MERVLLSARLDILDLRRRLGQARKRLADAEKRAEGSVALCERLGEVALEGQRRITAERLRSTLVVDALFEAADAEAGRILDAARRRAASIRGSSAQFRRSPSGTSPVAAPAAAIAGEMAPPVPRPAADLESLAV